MTEQWESQAFGITELLSVSALTVETMLVWFLVSPGYTPGDSIRWLCC